MHKTPYLLLFLTVLLVSCSSQAELSDLKQLPEAPHHENYQVEPLIGIERGMTAPDFALNDSDGKEVHLSSFRDQHQPVLFYAMATWCPYCAQDFKALSHVYQSYEQDVPIVIMSLDLSEDAQAISDYKKKYPKLEKIPFAPGKSSVLADYQITKTTTKYALNKNGIIIYKGSGVFSEEQWKTLLDALRDS